MVTRLALASAALAFAVACNPASSTPGTGASAPVLSLRVLASTTLLADLAKNVSGDRASVDAIAPTGAEVEKYEPKPEDAKRVAEADVIIVNGLGLDAWTQRLLRNQRPGARIVTLTENLPALEGNPHMWFDLGLARRYVEKIRDALSESDPGGQARYKENATRYAFQLSALDDEIRKKVATVPASRRKLVTSHDAFPYLAKAYGFEIVGFAQQQPGSDPTPAELAELVKKIKAENVPAVFSEAGVSPRLADALAREAGVKKIVSELPTDSLLDPPADTFVGLVRLVVDKIVDALR